MDDLRDHFGALIGDTPLLELRRFGERRGLRARILAKVEALNPAGSIKDRTAWGIVQAAEAEGRLVPGQLLVDLTSGNTGIGLAALAAARGYRAKFYLRASTSREKVALIHRYGAETVPIDDAEFLAPGGVDAIIARVRRDNPDAFYTNQRANPANPRIHHDTTGPEIWRDTDGAVDILIAAIGTGGTIFGTGRFLKASKPSVTVVPVEPAHGSVPTRERPQIDPVEGVHCVTGSRLACCRRTSTRASSMRSSLARSTPPPPSSRLEGGQSCQRASTSRCRRSRVRPPRVRGYVPALGQTAYGMKPWRVGYQPLLGLQLVSIWYPRPGGHFIHSLSH